MNKIIILHYTLFVSFLFCFGNIKDYKVDKWVVSIGSDSIHYKQDQPKPGEILDFDELDSTFIQALKRRVVVGINITGMPVQQVEPLFKSSNLKHLDCYVWAGSEGQFLDETHGKARQFEALGFAPGSEEQKKVKGWVPTPLKNSYSVYEILKHIHDYRDSLGIECEMSPLNSVLYPGKQYLIKLSFLNKLDENKTLELFTSAPILRDKSNGQLTKNSHREKFPELQHIKLGPNQSSSVTIDLSEIISSLEDNGHYYLYFKYNSSRGTGITDFIEIKVKKDLTLPDNN